MAAVLITKDAWVNIWANINSLFVGCCGSGMDVALSGVELVILTDYFGYFLYIQY